MKEIDDLPGLLEAFTHPARDEAVTFRVYDLGVDGQGSGVVVTVALGRYNWVVSLEQHPVDGQWRAVFEPSFSESVFDEVGLGHLVDGIDMIRALCAHLAAGTARA
ncbi:hypothetical protein QE410_000812 [Microbacterium sp. SORGH_AS 1204]|uniref:hypothetical protein n=1 Tax=Microbacterium sp. SORGH_AS_1204 TaxID=3041785 RepID=UPI00278D4C11|nr:hypothetical protein [Microbacterium sp. SORGH_AS_1204]MDQ1136013.1 hypothetical protein [Microbacterium sp. SORGH_AS_1204]